MQNTNLYFPFFPRWPETIMDPGKMCGSLFKHDPSFTMSSQYLGYTGAIQKFLRPMTWKSTITVYLPITVMRKDHSWDFEEKFVGSFDRQGVKFYTTKIHVTMTGFDMFSHKKKKMRVQ